MMTGIPSYLLLVLSMSATLLGSCLRNRFGKSDGKSSANISAFSLLTLLFVFFELLILAESYTCSPFTAALGTLFGVLTLAGTIAGTQMLACGPMGLSTVIVTSNMIVPALSGAVIWHEQISPLQGVGIVLMLVMLPLAVKGDRSRAVSVPWLIHCAVGFLAGGVIGILQKIHQSSPFRQESDAFLLIAFAVSVLGNAVLFLIDRKRGQRVTCSFSPRRQNFWLAAAVSVGVTLPNKINLYLSGAMDSAVFFPIVNGGGLLLSLLAAVLIFRERPTKRQWLGMAIGILAVLLLGL